MSAAPLVVEEPLLPAERERLDELEGLVSSGMATFVAVGRALREIKDTRLYRESFHSFEGYCRAKWDMGRDYAYKIIGASKVFDQLSVDSGIQPTHERQIRSLTSLSPDERAAAWSEAVELSNGTPTTASVEEAVHRRVRHANPQPQCLFWRKVVPLLTHHYGSTMTFEGMTGFDEDWDSHHTVIGYLPKQTHQAATFFYRAKQEKVRNAILVMPALTNEPWFHELTCPRVFVQDPKELLVVFYGGNDVRTFAMAASEFGICTVEYE